MTQENFALAREGPEIAIVQIGIHYGLVQKRIEPGYLLADGTVLLERERDGLGRYRGGAGMDGMYLQTGRLYVPVCGSDGQIRAFQEVKPENYLAAAEMNVEQNHNQIDGIINNEHPRFDELATEDEALFLVGGSAYLHIKTSEDDRDYSRDDCYTTYDFILYDKDTMRQLDSGRMEVAADIRDDPWQIHRLAAQNILECRTVLGGSSLEPVRVDILETLRSAAASRVPKPSLRDALRLCQQEAGSRAHGAVSPNKRQHGSER